MKLPIEFEKAQIRTFEARDLEAYAEMKSLLENESYQASDFTSHLEKPKWCTNLVCEVDGKLIGRLLIDQFFPFYPELINFDIHPDYQKQGYGTLLARSALKWMLEEAQAIPILKTEPDNLGAQKLYSKMGFCTVIPNSNELDEWKAYLHQYPLVSWIIEKSPKVELSPTFIKEDICKLSSRMNDVKNPKPTILQELMQKMRHSYELNLFDPQTNEFSLILMINGQPDQPGGHIGDGFSALGTPPLIKGVKLSNQSVQFSCTLEVLNEVGDFQLHCANFSEIALDFDIKPRLFQNCALKNYPQHLHLEPGVSKQFSFKLILSTSFNPSQFYYSSFESATISLLFTDVNHKIPTFHLTNGFWYRLLKKE